MNSDKMPYIIYDCLESLVRKIEGCTNNPEKPSTAKLGEHIPSEYSMSPKWAFDNVENNHTLYRGEGDKNLKKLYEKRLYFFKRTC